MEQKLESGFSSRSTQQLGLLGLPLEAAVGRLTWLPLWEGCSHPEAPMHAVGYGSRPSPFLGQQSGCVACFCVQ